MLILAVFIRFLLLKKIWLSHTKSLHKMLHTLKDLLKNSYFSGHLVLYCGS